MLTTSLHSFYIPTYSGNLRKGDSLLRFMAQPLQHHLPFIYSELHYILLPFIYVRFVFSPSLTFNDFYGRQNRYTICIVINVCIASDVFFFFITLFFLSLNLFPSLSIHARVHTKPNNGVFAYAELGTPRCSRLNTPLFTCLPISSTNDRRMSRRGPNRLPTYLGLLQHYTPSLLRPDYYSPCWPGSLTCLLVFLINSVYDYITAARLMPPSHMWCITSPSSETARDI